LDWRSEPIDIVIGILVGVKIYTWNETSKTTKDVPSE
jgi:hypothetical protein